MAQIARNHHYIPQFYLKGFTPGGRKKDMLWVLDLEQQKQWKSKPKGVGAARDFNSIDIKGVERDAVEKAYSEFESIVSEALTRISQQERFLHSDLVLLVEFAALLMTRNNAMRDTLEDAQQQMLWLLLQQSVVSKETWDVSQQSFRRDGVPVLSELSYEDAKQLVQEGFEYTVPRTEHVLRELSVTKSAFKMLMQREWTLYIAKNDSTGFVCSDRPVFCWWTMLMPEGIHPPGLEETDAIVSFPLSRNMALVGRLGGEGSIVRDVDDDIVGEINTRTVHSAESQVYSSQKDFICRAADGKLVWAAEPLKKSRQDRDLSEWDKIIAIFTNRGKYWIQVESYERDNQKVLEPVIRFWTKHIAQLREITNCEEVAEVYFFEEGQTRGGTRNLKFTSVSISEDAPTVLVADW